MEDLGAAGGGAGQQAFSFVSHQPLVVFGGHVAGHVFFGPGVEPGLKAPVQARVDPLVGLKETSKTEQHGSDTGTPAQEISRQDNIEPTLRLL